MIYSKVLISSSCIFKEVHASACKKQDQAEWGLFRSCNCDASEKDSEYKYDDQCKTSMHSNNVHVNNIITH